LVSFYFDIKKLTIFEFDCSAREQLMKPGRFSTKKTRASRISRSFLDLPDNKTTLKRRHPIGQSHGLWRSGHCSQIRFIEQIYIWKLIVPSMTKEPGKKYRGK
jgi:hypothetical protein